MLKGIAPPSPFPKARGRKSELAGHTSGRKCCVTPAFSGIPNKGDKMEAKKNKKNKTKNFPMVSLILQTAPTGV